METATSSSIGWTVAQATTLELEADWTTGQHGSSGWQRQPLHPKWVTPFKATVLRWPADKVVGHVSEHDLLTTLKGQFANYMQRVTLHKSENLLLSSFEGRPKTPPRLSQAVASKAQQEAAPVSPATEAPTLISAGQTVGLLAQHQAVLTQHKFAREKGHVRLRSRAPEQRQKPRIHQRHSRTAHGGNRQ